MDNLVSDRKGPDGQPTAVVIFVHGYGADGADLLGLADVLEPHLPNVAFYAPNAPDKSTLNPMGYQWFPIPWLDGSSEIEAGIGLAKSSDLLNRFIDDVLSKEGISADRLVLVGFSQGTMMSLHVGPRRADQLGGIVGFSGRLLQPETMQSEKQSEPPIFLAHGDRDEVVPFASMAEADEALEKAGFSVETHRSEGMGHGIAPDGLGRALEFIQRALKMSQ